MRPIITREMGDQVTLDTAPAHRDVAFVRRPVLDAGLGLVGWELVAEEGSVLIDALTGPGVDALTGAHPAWVSVGSTVLTELATVPMTLDGVVLQVRPGDGDPRELTAAMHRLSARGAAIALHAARAGDLPDALLDASSAVKLDLAACGVDALRDEVAALAGRRLGLVATSVDTREEFALCRALGFTAFQGRFLGEPETVPGSRVPTHRLQSLSAVADLAGSVDFEALERVVLRDVGLSHRLLRYVNSASVGQSRRLSSVHEAMVVLGAREVRRWAMLLTLSGVRDQSHPLLLAALVRARMCELLAEHGRRDRAFTVGLFSVINRLLGMPMREALAALPLADDVLDALLLGAGDEGRILRIIVRWEMGVFSAGDDFPGGRQRVARAHRDAIAWADEAATLT